MNRIYLWSSLFVLIFIATGVQFAPHNFLFWLASTSPSYTLMRFAAMGILFAQLATHPPRHLYVRILSAMSALVMIGWTIQQSINYHMQMLDTMGFLAVAIAILVESLENNMAKEVSTHNNSKLTTKHLTK